MYNDFVGGNEVYLSKNHEFNAFKREMKHWHKEKQKSKVSILKYITIMVSVFFALVAGGVYLNI